MDATIMNKIASLMQNDEFVVEFANCEGSEQLMALLAKKGISLTSVEFDDLLTTVCSIGGKELGETELESVAGGGKTWNFIKNSWKHYWGGFKPFGSINDAWNAGKRAANN